MVFMILTLIVANYFFVRMFWVKHFQMIILQRSPQLFMRLPKFWRMVFREFWVWDEIHYLPNIEDLRYE